ncbi:MAG: hypothetical protein K1W07_04095, partial [Parabacteroides distasonis]
PPPPPPPPPFFFQADDGIRVVAPSRGLGDVYKRQGTELSAIGEGAGEGGEREGGFVIDG